MQVIGTNEADFQMRALAERDGALVSGLCVLCVCESGRQLPLEELKSMCLGCLYMGTNT